MQNHNTNPERKSLSELVKSVGEGKVILIDGGFDVVEKHIALIEKMSLKHEVLLVHMNDLLEDDLKRLREHVVFEKNKEAFSGGGIEQLIKESAERLHRELKMIEDDIVLDSKEKPILPEKTHDFGIRKQTNYNSFKPLPKKVLGFRGRR